MRRSVGWGWDLLLLAWDFTDFFWQSMNPGVPHIYFSQIFLNLLGQFHIIWLNMFPPWGFAQNKVVY